jgi:plastocyanin
MRLQLSAMLLVLVAGDAMSRPQGGGVRGTATVGHKARAGVVVYLEGVPGTAVAPKEHPQIRQYEKQFDPQLTVVVKGTTVDFPNEDKIAHNVFSVSRPARFDLGLYKSGTMKSVEMKRVGTVDVYCNIHPDMIAKVKVLENSYFTETKSDGSFKIDNVPPGEYPVVAWLPNGDEARGTVKVTEGAAAEVSLDVKEVAKKEAHTRKDGTPYGRYK